MKVKLLVGLLVVGAFPFVFSSCKDDEVPKSGISFEKAEEETFESNSTFQSFHPDLSDGGKGHDIIVKLVLSRPVDETVVVNYSVTGTASMVNPGESYLVNDFAIKEGSNTIIGTDKLTILKGATEANIKITVFEDLILANDEMDDVELETVVLKLESIESGPATLDAAASSYTLSIKEDDSVIVLTWMDADTELVGDIDMDLFLWNEGELFDTSNSPNEDNPEESYEVLLLYGGYPEGDYGLSYTYYKGTSDNVNFYALMLGYFNGEFYNYAPEGEDEVLVYGGNYKLANLNEYDVTEVEPAIVQTMQKNDFNYETSEITIPESGSRSGSPKLMGSSKLSLKQIEQIKREQLTSFLKNRKIDVKALNKGTLTK